MNDEDNYDGPILALKIFRGVVYLSIYFCFGCYSYLFLTLKPYHPNLRCLLILYIPTILLASLSKFVTDVSHALSIELSEFTAAFFLQMSDIALICMTYTLLAVVVERIIAAIYVGDYEWIHGGRPLIGIGLYLFFVFLASVVNFLVYWKVMHVHATFIITPCSLIFGTLFFLLLPYFTNRQFKKHTRNRFQFTVTVSEKYMQLENVHSANMMRILGPFLAISNGIFVGYFIYIRLNVDEQSQYFLLLLDIFFTMEPMGSLGIMFISALCHRRVRHHIYVRICCRNQVQQDLRMRKHSTLDNGGDHHFEGLREAWA